MLTTIHKDISTLMQRMHDTLDQSRMVSPRTADELLSDCEEEVVAACEGIKKHLGRLSLFVANSSAMTTNDYLDGWIEALRNDFFFLWREYLDLRRGLAEMYFHWAGVLDEACEREKAAAVLDKTLSIDPCHDAAQDMLRSFASFGKI